MEFMEVKEDTTTTKDKERVKEKEARQELLHNATSAKKFGHVAANCWYKDST